MSQERCNGSAGAERRPRYAGSTNSGRGIRNLEPRKVPAWPQFPIRGAGRKRGGKMGNEETARSRVERTEPIPEMRPWLEVGWIFRDGDAQVIERHADCTDVRAAPVSDE